MINQVFYNLDEEKRYTILNAIKKELVGNGIDNTKVVNICKQANIPRSAFYRYFDSLHDAVEALVEHIHQKYQIENMVSNYKEGNSINDSLDLLEKALSNKEEFIVLKYGRQKVKQQAHSMIENNTSDGAVIFEMLLHTVVMFSIAHYKNGIPKEMLIQKFKQYLTTLQKYGIN